MAKLYTRYKNGKLQPIKTAVAEHFPLMTRLARRALVRSEKKMIERAERRNISATV